MTLKESGLTDEELMKLAASAYGRRGGKSSGPKKARSPDHYRRIAKLGAVKKAQNKAAKPKPVKPAK
jgi:hypothetical protein